MLVLQHITRTKKEMDEVDRARLEKWCTYLERAVSQLLVQGPLPKVKDVAVSTDLHTATKRGLCELQVDHKAGARHARTSNFELDTTNTTNLTLPGLTIPRMRLSLHRCSRRWANMWR